ncbi:MBL fold metallo-hydrolase [Leptolyngbya ohadii]|uniref:MBL fold metallo-hydrolase n=1 Tax=Leptolyngbya ohadii TaxID=1962290 RepID=UPI000B59C3AE|nr:MBL fold metallo-hydrolase [Leptolyngbya ohadii]
MPTTTKPPRPIFDTLYAFPPNRDIAGGTAYLILEEGGNVLVDCPAWDEPTRSFLQEQGGVKQLFLTHRGAIGQVKAIQQETGCEVVIQEQEAYLLPQMAVTTFQQEIRLSPHSLAIWTPGHSPGSACLYHDRHGGILFTGRHLLPNQQGNPVPLRIAKTFHWHRQLKSLGALRDRFTPETLQFLCPGANTGFLRGERSIDRAYDRLSQLDLEALRLQKPGL